MDDLEFNPEVFEFEKKNKLIKVTMTKPVEDLLIAGRDLSSTPKGQDVQLPFWAADVLINANVAVTRETQKLNYEDFHKILWKEQRENQLQKLPEEFYILAKELMSSLREKASKETHSLDSIKELTQFETLLRDTVSIRLSKIVKISLRGGDLHGIINSMTSEEAWLYQRLTKLLRCWEKGILGK
nr:hypothetical protein [Candidatus Njordarchaeum guaymaensis]